MEKHKQVIAEGSWNSTRISKQVEHAEVSLLFIPDKPRACDICLSWDIYEQVAWKEIVQTGTKEKKKTNHLFIPFWLSPSSGWWWFGPVMCLPSHFSSCILSVSVRMKEKLPESLCIASLYLVRVLNIAHFLKKKERQNKREKIKAETFKVKWFSSLKSAFISL